MTRRLWSYQALANAVNAGSAEGPDVFGIGIDSRLTEPGDLFVALTGDPGPRFQPSTRSERDGHDYARNAVEKGAVAVLAHRNGDYGAPTLLVKDTLDGLWDIGRAARRRLDGPAVAVTGSSGKTTFKSFAAAALGAFATSGSLNNHIGVPLSLGRTPRDADAAVFEIGTNHPGEIEPLARLVEPDVAVLLNVHPAHIENFGSLEAIRREKVSIAKGLRSGGVFVHPAALVPDHDGRCLTFGAEHAADVRLVDVDGERAEIETSAGRLRVPVPGGGAHRALSVCAVAAVLVALEVPPKLMDRLGRLTVPRGRGNRIEVDGVTIIDESYNANPASMAATLDAFSAEPRRRLAILGDMRELGPDTPRYHAQLAEHCNALEGVFCVGRAIEALYNALPVGRRLGLTEQADAEFASYCARRLQPGDRVLVKGSNTVFWTKRFVAMLAREIEGRGGGGAQ
ncbi:MAG: UDP-N-acetylmuramoyl-tripeptide--D-alanyl-D-alanine ligase [Gammaproteobacteria bacterium]|nr:UDP-N-acetylmuramoyl-tripeptide--D-alanyl-D-alanine ligase [Gammaproteobacteria bacterium]MYF29150.1 UDP-N-acetylmuramoyl-tripeptide--D-alanyl-D-alanine ligase [Gammaproteobacteria bacterium]MYK48266.1 UDP-N-acetylmuramoyl-tripeptide--D-alanyl-D-alanine ligase [Gammaproteobacteria bacterium]